MKASLCCKAAPIKLAGNLDSVVIGICPKCGDHTEFVDLVYKVICPGRNDIEVITADRNVAADAFDQYKEYRYDVELYEALTPESEEEEPDWELVKCKYQHEEV